MSHFSGKYLYSRKLERLAIAGCRWWFPRQTNRPGRHLSKLPKPCASNWHESVGCFVLYYGIKKAWKNLRKALERTTDGQRSWIRITLHQSDLWVMIAA